jgi:hypothetical protein
VSDECIAPCELAISVVLNNNLPMAKYGSSNADIRLQINEHVSFLKLGDRKAIFSSQSQTIFEMNDSAAFLASCIADRPTMGELVATLKNNGLSEARALAIIRTFITNWSRANIVSAKVSTHDIKPDHVESVTIADQKFALHYFGEALAKGISPVFANMRSPIQGRDNTFCIVASDSLVFISRLDSPAQIVESCQACTALKGMLTNALLTKARFALALHCAMLIYKGHALLLIGPPGAGKTTLALALINRGFVCAGDDIALLMQDGCVQGVPYAPSLKSGAWKLSSQLSLNLSALQVHKRLDGRQLRYITETKLAPQKSIAVKWIMALQRTGSDPARLQLNDSIWALKHLIGGAYAREKRLDATQLRLIANLVSRANLTTLHYSDVIQAAQMVELNCENN